VAIVSEAPLEGDSYEIVVGSVPTYAIVTTEVMTRSRSTVIRYWSRYILITDSKTVETDHMVQIWTDLDQISCSGPAVGQKAVP
jgi:hypothetical protein